MLCQSYFEIKQILQSGNQDKLLGWGTGSKIGGPSPQARHAIEETKIKRAGGHGVLVSGFGAFLPFRLDTV